MSEKRKKLSFKSALLFICIGGLLGVVVMIAGVKAIHYTSEDEFCMSCHIHPHADEAWKKSSHVNNPSGVRVHCVDCHLPPPGSLYYLTEKAKTGLRDVWSYMTKDSADIDWESKRLLENAMHHVYNESCLECHVNLFPPGLNDDGITAHLYYEENHEKLNLQCISCHMGVGHYNPNLVHSKMSGIPGAVSANTEVYADSAVLTGFNDFTEYIPGTVVSFNMKAIPGGSFKMGTDPKDKFHQEGESPVRNVSVSPFYMAELEVTWDMYWAFYAATMSEGRIAPEVIFENNSNNPTVDAISGPTPPFGFPDQGWGGGQRPAITMTPYAAEIFCQWLSAKTGKTYRLPTEAEWEYAARGGTDSYYFFEGNPKDFSDQGFWRKFFEAKTEPISEFIIYKKNSQNKTQEPDRVKANPFGLKNMLGNVLEYCSDFYAPDAYTLTPQEVKDPKGPEEGKERVVRGGDFASDALDLRCASRRSTQHDAWLKTDPQQPKSIWWYSDIRSIGFRVVCEP